MALKVPDFTIRRLHYLDTDLLSELFFSISQDDNTFFTPHNFDSLTARGICLDLLSLEDIYYVVEKDDIFLGYGFLRGWDEGFIIPMLGIYLLPEARGIGLAKKFISFILQDCPTMVIRLHVSKYNLKAICLYVNVGFKTIEEDGDTYLMEYTK